MSMEEKAQAALAVVQRKDDSAIATVDLEGLKTKFFAASMSLRDFAGLYSAEIPGLYQRATKDGWLQQRKAFREGISKDARSRMLDRSADFESKLDGMVHRTSKKLARLIGEILTTASDMNEKAKNGEEHGRAMSLDDLPKLRSGIEALQQSYVLARKTAGLSPEPMPGGNELDLSRINHEEREMLEALLRKASRVKH